MSVEIVLNHGDEEGIGTMNIDDILQQMSIIHGRSLSISTSHNAFVNANRSQKLVFIGIDGLQRLVALVDKIKSVELSPEASCVSQSSPPVYQPEYGDPVAPSPQGESETISQCPEPNAGKPDGRPTSGGVGR